MSIISVSGRAHARAREKLASANGLLALKWTLHIDAIFAVATPYISLLVTLAGLMLSILLPINITNQSSFPPAVLATAWPVDVGLMVGALTLGMVRIQTPYNGPGRAIFYKFAVYQLFPYTDSGHELQLIIGFAEPVALFCVRLPTRTIEEVPDRRGYRFAMAGSGADFLQGYAPKLANLLACGPTQNRENKMIAMAVATVETTIDIEEWQGETSYLAKPVAVLRWNPQSMNWMRLTFSCKPDKYVTDLPKND